MSGEINASARRGGEGREERGEEWRGGEGEGGRGSKGGMRERGRTN